MGRMSVSLSAPAAGHDLAQRQVGRERPARPSVAGQHIVTVALEDYFQVGAFNERIQRGQWYRFENRLEQSAAKTLDLLDRFKVKATFFVLGWIADRYPEIVRRVAEHGHEI